MPRETSNKICSLFFLGTTHHRDNKKGRYNIINQYFKNTEASEAPTADTGANHFKRLFDGPGGVADTDEGRSTNPTPGLYYTDFDTNKKKKLSGNKEKELEDFWHNYQYVTGTIFGEGVKENVTEALCYIESLAHKGKLPSKLNLYGYSRGGDTAVILSNMLKEIHPEIEVNMCLVDPVPGGDAIKTHHSKVIPSTVKNMTVFLMQDEATPGFTPTDQEHMMFEAPSHTRVNYQIYRGVHGTGTIGTEDANLSSARMLMHDGFFKFCKKNGTIMKGDKPAMCGFHNKHNGRRYEAPFESLSGLSGEDRLKQYQLMHQNKEHFVAEALKLPKRHLDYSVREGYYHRDSDFFVNQEHRELFAQRFPAIFDHFFKHGMAGYNKEYILLEIKEIYNNSEWSNSLYQDLYHRGLKYDHENSRIISMPLPTGSPIPEVMPVTYGLPINYDEIHYMKYAIRSFINTFEVLYDAEHVGRDSEEKLHITNQILSISRGLKNSLVQFDLSSTSNKEKIIKLRKAVLNEYLKIENSLIYRWRLRDFSIINQIRSLIASDLYAYKIKKILSSIFRSNPESTFRRNISKDVPVDKKKMLHDLLNMVSGIETSSSMPERDKIVALKIINNDIKNCLQSIPKNKSAQRIDKLIEELNTVEYGYKSYAHGASKAYEGLANTYSRWANFYYIFSFLESIKQSYLRNLAISKRAAVTAKNIADLDAAGNGNNKDAIILELEKSTTKNYELPDVDYESAFKKTIRKAKEEAMVLRTTEEHFFTPDM